MTDLANVTMPEQEALCEKQTTKHFRRCDGARKCKNSVFLELRQERRLDTNRVFLYKDKAIQRIGTESKTACRRAGITNLRIHDFRHTTSTNLRRAGVDRATAMKIVGHKSDRMHRRYNTIELEDLHRAAAMLNVYRSNTVITPDVLATSCKI